MSQIFASPYRDFYALVDQVDYDYFTQWRWCKFISRKGVVYLRRAMTVDWTRLHDGTYDKTNVTLYLHREILKRVQPPPNDGPYVASHINGNSLDCRRANLEWQRNKKNTVIWGGVAAYSLCIPTTHELEDIPF